MKIPRLRPSLLTIALCAIMAIFVLKLALVVGGSLVTPNIASVTSDEVLASQEKTQKPAAESEAKGGSSLVSESHASPPPIDKAVKTVKSQAVSPGEALSFIQQRENELRRKEEMLKEKEERLAKIEKEVEQKTKELLAIQKDIQSYRNEKQDTTNVKVKSLAKIYGTMKPKEAARLLENLDDKLVMGIISTMTSDEAAAILSIMEVKKAAKISEALSGK